MFSIMNVGIGIMFLAVAVVIMYAKFQVRGQFAAKKLDNETKSNTNSIGDPSLRATQSLAQTTSVTAQTKKPKTPNALERGKSNPNSNSEFPLAPLRINSANALNQPEHEPIISPIKTDSPTKTGTDFGYDMDLDPARKKSFLSRTNSRIVSIQLHSSNSNISSYDNQGSSTPTDRKKSTLGIGLGLGLGLQHDAQRVQSPLISFNESQQRASFSSEPYDSTSPESAKLRSPGGNAGDFPPSTLTRSNSKTSSRFEAALQKFNQPPPESKLKNSD